MRRKSPIARAEAINPRSREITREQILALRTKAVILLDDSEYLEDLGNGRSGRRVSYRVSGVNYLIDDMDDASVPGVWDWWAQPTLRVTVQQPRPDLDTAEYFVFTNKAYFLVGAGNTPVMTTEHPMFRRDDLSVYGAPDSPDYDMMPVAGANETRVAFDQILKSQFEVFGQTDFDELMDSLRSLEVEDRVPASYWES